MYRAFHRAIARCFSSDSEPSPSTLYPTLPTLALPLAHQWCIAHTCYSRPLVTFLWQRLWLLLGNQDSSSTTQKIKNKTAKIRAVNMTVYGQNRSKWLYFLCLLCNVQYIKTILNENTDSFRKSQVPAGLYFFIKQSYYTYISKRFKMTVLAVLV